MASALNARTHTHKTVTQQREREGPTETALPGRCDKLSIRFRGVLRPGGPASGPAGTMTCSWTFGPSLPVRPARLSSAHALHPPDPGPCAGIGEDQRKTSLPAPGLATQRERRRGRPLDQATARRKGVCPPHVPVSTRPACRSLGAWRNPSCWVPLITMTTPDAGLHAGLRLPGGLAKMPEASGSHPSCPCVLRPS